ncbi:MAG: hypothetical protein K6T78_12260 [Alicyclobacillus sp.]|nr:hypothetical protein [Alicyclobacillus sp.]
MLSLARNGFTAEQVDAALHAPVRKMYFRYDLLDANNNFKAALTTVTGGTITYDTTQQIKRTATFTLQDDPQINYLTDRIKPWARVWVPGTPGWSTTSTTAFVQPHMSIDVTTVSPTQQPGGWAEFPLGVFLLSTPPRQTDDALVVTRQVQAYDQLQILVDDKVTDRYTVTAGTNYISAVASLLESAGITQTNLTPTSLTLPTALDWQIGTDKLTIINALLTAINYRTLWFDADGVAVAEPYVTPDQRAPEYTYQDDSQSVMLPQVKYGLDLFAVPNQWVAVVSETDRSVLVSNYTNSNASSPTSTLSRNRNVVKLIQNATAPDQTTLDTYVQTVAYQDSQIYDSLTFSTAIMPFHSDRDVFQINFSALGISDKFEEMSWSFPLQAGGQMTHSVSKVVSI